jgi:N-methylhydantoinase A
MRRALFEGGWRDVEVFRRQGLPVGFRAAGPTILEEEGATTVVPPGWMVGVDRWGLLRLEVK